MKPAVGVSLDVNKDELIPASLMCSEDLHFLYNNCIMTIKASNVQSIENQMNSYIIWNNARR